MIGAIFFLLIVLTSVLFVGTLSERDCPVLGRLTLVQISVAGLLHAINAGSIWYVVWGAVFVAVAGGYCIRASYGDAFNTTLTCFLSLSIFVVGALLVDGFTKWNYSFIISVVVLGMFFTYTPAGTKVMTEYRKTFV